MIDLLQIDDVTKKRSKEEAGQGKRKGQREWMQYVYPHVMITTLRKHCGSVTVNKMQKTNRLKRKHRWKGERDYIFHPFRL